MKSQDYQEWAITKNTPSYDELFKRLKIDGTFDILHAAMGVSGEAGELMDAVKKHILYGKELDVKNLKEELGDLMWYMNLMISTLGTSWEEIMQMNHDKLEKRYPSGFTEQAAQVRADKIEPLKRIPKKMNVTVFLEEVGPMKVNTIKAIRNHTGMGLQEALDLVNGVGPARSVVMRTSYKKAYKLADELNGLGCKVFLR